MKIVWASKMEGGPQQLVEAPRPARVAQLNMHWSGKRFLLNHVAGRADRVALMQDRGEIVAFFRYRTKGDGRIIRTLGTWVRPDRRSRGYAAKLWRKVAFTEVVMEWESLSVSRGGRKLLRSFEEQLPGIIVRRLT